MVELVAGVVLVLEGGVVLVVLGLVVLEGVVVVDVMVVVGCAMVTLGPAFTTGGWLTGELTVIVAVELLDN